MPHRLNLMLCTGTGCVSNKSFDIMTALQDELKKHNLEKEIGIVITGCNGFCAMGPIVVVQPDGIFYQKITLQDVSHLVEEHFLKGRPVEKLMYVPPKEKEPIPVMSDIPFFGKQMLITLRNRGLIDPENIDEYIARDGYKGFTKAITTITPEQVIEEIKTSELRGRGGGGFPTGLKWEVAYNTPSDEKYLIVNCDEGDPGAFMDRSIVESDPHSVIEGILIGAYALDIKKCFIYVRMEYPLALKRFYIAIDQARKYGLLGKDILGKGMDFDIEVHHGAGAFICGEETALINSIQGLPGEAEAKYVYPAQYGLNGKPTIINNVETWATIPQILLRGAKWFSSIGTQAVEGVKGGSKGTKVFSLVGKVNNTGLVEVPMGITLREIIYDIGGGIKHSKKFRAVQTGGPSGGFIPASLLDLPVDYEELLKVGSMMGSGGMVVMDEDNCMVDMARYFLDFVQSESCGKCVPCREGTKRMLDILNRITRGQGREEDLELLEELCYNIAETSLCALGGTAPNPVLSMLHYFKDEYEAHVKYKRCSAAVCKSIISSPCQHVCPIDTEASEYIAYIARGEFDKAYEIIVKDNPLLGVCSRVCNHPCEMKCRTGQGGGDPVSIRALKRAAIDYSSNKKYKYEKEKQNGIKVAIVGSGPSGLTAAHALALKGYSPTIYEAESVVGGMLILGIPNYRLPREVLNDDIELVKSAGVDIKTNQKLGRDFSIQDLFNKGNKAIYLALGAHKSLKLDIPNEDAEGVIPAVEFLKSANLGKKVSVGKVVAIVGGGDCAMDAARSALRSPGVEKVYIIYRRTRMEMPAYTEEIEEALEEGIEIKFLTIPTKVITKDNKVCGIVCQKMALGDVDSSGRRRPIPIEGSEYEIKIDTLIQAISEEPDVSCFKHEKLNISDWKTLVIDEETLATNIPGVFSGGDVARGPGTVIRAMADGKKAAKSIDKYIKGEKLEFEYHVTRPSVYVEPIELTEEEYDIQKQETMKLAVNKRTKNLNEVDLGLDKEFAIKEAKRCLRCDMEAKVEDEKNEQVKLTA